MLIWDPSVLDCEFDLENWKSTHTDPSTTYSERRFNTVGDYLCRHVNGLCTMRDAQEHAVTGKAPDHQALCPHFAWAPADVVQRTYAATTQYAKNILRLPFRKHFKSRFPALNVFRRREAVATDTVYADTPAIDDGATAAQVIVGTTTMVTDIYGIKSDKEFVNTLEDQIRKRGAMDKLISDRAQVEISKKVQDLLRAYVIDDWQSEPHHQHQNFAERRIQTLKDYTNTVLDRTGAPPKTWLLALGYASYV
jgi:hypothetical protein